MVDGPDFLLAKFGKKEHLEDLKNGKIFFSALKKYRNDGTVYRGDSMEGRVPIDPDKVQMLDQDGNDIWPLLKNLGESVSISQSWVGDDDLLMFCAAAITKEIMENKEKDRWILKSTFKNAIKDFGTHVILISSRELREKIICANEKLENSMWLETGLIIYRDLLDFSGTDVYRRTGSQLDPYFVKSINIYKNQNEWRMILCSEKKLQLNEFEGYIIEASPFEFAPIFETNEFLNGFSLEGIK